MRNFEWNVKLAKKGLKITEAFECTTNVSKFKQTSNDECKYYYYINSLMPSDCKSISVKQP